MGAALDVTREEHTSQELRRMANETKDPRQARRMQAISFVIDGQSRGEVAEFAGVGRQTLRDWVKQYNEHGPEALATITSPGRPRLLTPRQAEELHEVVVKGPDLKKDGVVRWRCVDLVKHLAERFNVPEVHPSTMGKWLRRLRLTKMTTRPFHPKKDDAAQEEFKRNFKAEVDKKLPPEVKEQQLPLEVWFQDEARVG